MLLDWPRRDLQNGGDSARPIGHLVHTAIPMAHPSPRNKREAVGDVSGESVDASETVRYLKTGRHILVRVIR